MLSVTIPEPVRPHEIVLAFEKIGLPLSKTLAAMLNEAPEHCRPRRGCGYTQAGRLLADIVNQPRSLSANGDLRVFAESAAQKIAPWLEAATALTGHEPRALSAVRTTLSGGLDGGEFDAATATLLALEELGTRLQLEESRVLIGIILSLLGAESRAESVHDLPSHPEKLAIGTCPEAERHFLELAGGHVRRGGSMNVIVDAHDQPVLVEKINIGDSHSCIAIQPVRINGVRLPAGSLIGARYSALPVDTPPCSSVSGSWIPSSVCQGFRFMRLTTLAISPENRARAFTKHVERQCNGNFLFDPLNTKLAELAVLAARQRPVRNVRKASGI